MMVARGGWGGLTARMCKDGSVVKQGSVKDVPNVGGPTLKETLLEKFSCRSNGNAATSVWFPDVLPSAQKKHQTVRSSTPASHDLCRVSPVRL